MLTIKRGQHGSTYGGNPVAAKVAQAALQVLVDENLAENSQRMGKLLRSQLQAIPSSRVATVISASLLNGYFLHISAPAAIMQPIIVEEGKLKYGSANFLKSLNEMSDSLMWIWTELELELEFKSVNHIQSRDFATEKGNAKNREQGWVLAFIRRPLLCCRSEVKVFWLPSWLMRRVMEWRPGMCAWSWRKWDYWQSQRMATSSGWLRHLSSQSPRPRKLQISSAMPSCPLIGDMCMRRTGLAWSL